MLVVPTKHKKAGLPPKKQSVHTQYSQITH